MIIPKGVTGVNWSDIPFGKIKKMPFLNILNIELEYLPAISHPEKERKKQVILNYDLLYHRENNLKFFLFLLNQNMVSYEREKTGRKWIVKEKKNVVAFMHDVFNEIKLIELCKLCEQIAHFNRVIWFRG